jgi:hypothetical protein
MRGRPGGSHLRPQCEHDIYYVGPCPRPSFFLALGSNLLFGLSPSAALFGSYFWLLRVRPVVDWRRRAVYSILLGYSSDTYAVPCSSHWPIPLQSRVLIDGRSKSVQPPRLTSFALESHLCCPASISHSFCQRHCDPKAFRFAMKAFRLLVARSWVRDRVLSQSCSDRGLPFSLFGIASAKSA